MAGSAFSQPSPDRPLVADRFEVRLNEPLGSGGLSILYRAYDRYGDTMVAAKRLKDTYRQHPEARQRFRREGRLTSVADHPNIVAMVDFELDPNWMFLELLEGQDLKEYLASHGQVDLETVVIWTSQIASALDRIHSFSIVHLDLKPQNLFLTSDGAMKVIDFGVAQEFASQQDRVGEDLFGTAAYLAPEQPANRPVNARTDVYALGCVFYELIAGRTPFLAEGLSAEDEQNALVKSHAEDDVPPPSEVRPDLALPTWVDDVVDRAMAKDPQHRFETAGAMARAARRGIGLPEIEVAQPAQPRLERRQRQPVRNFSPSQEEAAPPAIPSGHGSQSGTVRSFTRPHLPEWIRRSARFQRYRMRTLILSVILTVIVAFNLLGSAGQVDDLILFAAPAISTDVITDDLRLRQQPSLNGEVITTLQPGAEVAISGAPTRANDLLWWPVVVDLGDTTARGWVWSDGIKSTGWMNAVTTGDEWASTAGNVVGWVGDRLP